jgi:hypothetical protein
MRRPGRSAPLIGVLAVAFAAVPAWAAAGRLAAPRSAKIGAAVTVHASALISGRYALTLVADAHPAQGASCVARLSKSKASSGGAVTLSGTIPRRLVCYQGLATWLGAVPTAAGDYHLVVAEPTAPAGFDARGSFVRSALRVTR